jgi:hypothetical protein
MARRRGRKPAFRQPRARHVPWTSNQRELIAALCDEVGAVFPTEPLSMYAASEFIGGLRARRRLRLFGRAAKGGGA